MLCCAHAARPVRRIFRIVPLIVSSLAMAEEAEKPGLPYPYELPPWFEKIDRKLRQPIDLAIPEGTSLKEALAAVESLTGTRIELADPDGSLVGRSVVLAPVEAVPVENVLHILGQLAGIDPSLRVCRAPGTVVLTNRPEKYPVPKAVPIRRELDRWRRQLRRGLKRRGPTPEQIILKRLGETNIRFLRYKNEPLDEVVKYLREVARVNLGIDPTLDPEDLRVTADVAGVTARQFFESTVRKAGLTWVVRENILVITTEKRAVPDREREKRRLARELELKRLLQRRVPHEFRSMTVQEIVKPLAESLGVPVHAGPEAWKSTARIPSETAGKSLEYLRSALRTIRVELVVPRRDAIFLVQRR